MKKIALSIAVLAAFWALGTTAAHATVLNFDDLTNDLTLDGGTTLYDGVNFTGWYNYNEAQPPYNASSGSGRIYDTASIANDMSFSSPVTFDGAWFAGNAFAPVTFDGYQGSTLVWTSSTLTPSGTPTFLDFGSSIQVDNVVVDSPSPDFFIMDDVTFDQSSTSPVPEPATMALFAVGLLGLAGARRILA